jgi:hypothetical protein
MHANDRNFVRPTIEFLEGRTLFATSALSPAFVVAGTGTDPFGGPDVARVVRVDGLTGTATVVAQFPRSLGLNPAPPLLDRINDVALAPDGTLLVVGTGDPPSGVLQGDDVVKVVRVNPATSATTLVAQFLPSGGIQTFPPLLSRATGIVATPDGGIFLAGKAILTLGDTTESVRVVRVDPATGTGSEIVHFTGSLNALATLASVADIAALPGGDLVIAGVGNSGGGFGGIGPSDVVKVLRVSPADGATTTISQFNTGFNQPATLTDVNSVAVDAAGNVLVVGRGLDLPSATTVAKVLRLDPATSPAAGTQVAKFASNVLTGPTGVAFAPVQGAIGVAGVRALTLGGVTGSTARVVRVNPVTGAPSVVISFPATIGGAGNSLLKTPTGIAAGPVATTAAPVTTVSGPKKGVVGRARSFVLKAAVPKSERPADGVYTYQVDWDGDGTTDETLTGGRKLRARHTFDSAATFTVSATAIGRDGALGFVGVHAITIADA